MNRLPGTVPTGPVGYEADSHFAWPYVEPSALLAPSSPQSNSGLKSPPIFTFQENTVTGDSECFRILWLGVDLRDEAEISPCNRKELRETETFCSVYRNNETIGGNIRAPANLYHRGERFRSHNTAGWKAATLLKTTDRVACRQPQNSINGNP